MKTNSRLIVFMLGLACLATANMTFAQSLDLETLKKPPTTTWGTVLGDYSGRRDSPLTAISAKNVKSLTLAWTHSFNYGPDSRAELAEWGKLLKATPIMVDGVLYIANDDHAFALDALTGHEIWRFDWPDSKSIHNANRGLAMYQGNVYLTTPNNYLISLNAKDGKERWRVHYAEEGNWFSSTAPIVIKNHVLVGPGNDDPIRGYLDSYDADTGKHEWRWYATPDPGGPGSETWDNPADMPHGGGNPWQSGTYDPELNLYYFGTGDGRPNGRKPHPNAEGEDSLYTASIIALNPDTGKMVWHFQCSPHDVHDYDNTQIPVLFDGEIKGVKRKLLAQASRNGYFFVLDRETGKNYLTTKFLENTNWATGVNAYGHPIPNYDKEANPQGTLVSPYAMGATNWWAPAFDTKRGLFFVNASRTFAYANRSGGGRLRHPNEYVLQAIDYQTGKIVWSHELGDQAPGSSGPAIAGLLVTAGDLLFTGDASGNLLALDPATGKTLWHVNVGDVVTNGPMTYELQGKQYVTIAAGSQLFAFTLPEK
jgi:acido-empty-quinoprotein group A